MHRRKTGDLGIQVLPFLWQLENVKDYNPDMQNTVLFEGNTSNPVYFLLDTLWPRLIQALGLETRSRKMLVEQLFTYISIQSGSGRGVPTDFIRFVNDHGIALTLPSTETKTNAVLWSSSSQTEGDLVKEYKGKTIAGVAFSSVFKDNDKEWNRKILERKSHIEENLKRLARFGTVTYGKAEIETARLGMFGFGATVVRLDVEVEVDDNLSPEANAIFRKAICAIAQHLRDSGATDEELEIILIGTAWKG